MEFVAQVAAVILGVVPIAFGIVKWEISRHIAQDNEQDRKLAHLERDYVSQKQFEDAMRRFEDRTSGNFERLHARLDELYRALMSKD